MKWSISNVAIVCVAGVLLLFGTLVSAKCPGEWLGDMLDYENPRVIRHLQTIESKGKGYRVPGITLCDGSKILVNLVFHQAVHTPLLGQHVYLFEENGTSRAVAWVESGGSPLKIPPCPDGGRCENVIEASLVISGDVYTWALVQPGHHVVLLMYPTADWVKDLTR